MGGAGVGAANRPPYWFESPLDVKDAATGEENDVSGEEEKGGLLSAGNSILRALFPPR